MKLFPHQEKAVKFALRARYSLNFSEVGCGKSPLSLIAAKRSGEDLLVFGPAFLKQNWLNEGEKWGVKVTYAPYSQLHKWDAKKAGKFGFWVADEIHFLKSVKAKRTNTFHTLLETCRPRYFLGLTGTPVKNRVPEIWTLLQFCSLCPTDTNGKHSKLGFWQFCNRYTYKETYWIYGREVTKFEGMRNVEELKGLLKGKYIKHKLDEVVSGLPDTIRKDVHLSLKGIPEDLLEEYESGSAADSSGKALSALMKAQHTVKYVEDLRDQTESPILVFTDHRGPAKEIAESLGCDWITGEIHPDVRAKLVDKFQKGEIEYMVMTLGSMSVGVTLTAANHIVFNDLSWVPGDNAQAKGRIRRIGQKKTCVYHYMHATPTDAYINDTLIKKEETINELGV